MLTPAKVCSYILLNDKEFCSSLIGLSSTFLVVPQSEFTSREPQGVYSGFQRCPKKGKNFKNFIKFQKCSRNFKIIKLIFALSSQKFLKFQKISK
jgi:hypothetical protein